MLDVKTKEAIETIYEVFSKYKLKVKIVGCQHCELENLEINLHQKNLKYLNWKDLGIYLFKAMTTFGDVNDFKHFLPRIFELFVEDFYTSPIDFEVLLSKLEYAHWYDWDNREKSSIKLFSNNLDKCTKFK
jgi:hypothetical protein